MALTESNMMPLGTVAPSFTLYDTITGKELSFADRRGQKGTVVMFICNHCPYVIHIQDEVVKISHEFSDQGIDFIAISSNDVDKYPLDSPELMKIHAEKYGFNFPYLYDESQEVAKSYKAACTPDFYLFDENDVCVYRGRMDASTPGNGIPVTGEDLRNALSQLINLEEINEKQAPSMGCNIKWKR
ncbi:thioredoxin family protein [Reichenbachiella versicolor]|uniref:thioredoxin family protein n=1 Tax=Reichenbachiella versicolor TaxID=1821036 RepID=UPI000D6E4E10|nr:thioredoxin family protein [Reichenbachiella versicolor]